MEKEPRHSYFSRQSKTPIFIKGNGWELVPHPTAITMEFPVTDQHFGASKRNNPSESGNLSLMGGNREKASRTAPEQLKDVRV